MIKKLNNNIAFIIPDLNGGGAQRMILNMAEEFACRAFKVDIVTLCESHNNQYRVPSHENIKHIKLNSNKALYSTPKLIKYFRKNKPSHIVSALTYVNLITIVAKKLSFIKHSDLYVTERAYHSINSRMTVAHHNLEKLLIRLLYKHAKKVIGISHGVTHDIMKTANLPDNKGTTIYNPVITPAFETKELEFINHEWFSDNPDIKKIIACGRLVEVKDYRTLIEAFSILAKNIKVKLAIIGEGPMKDDLVRRAKDLNIEEQIEFISFVQNPLPFIKNSDLFVSTSLSEGFGNVIVEALYCGTPIVSTDCPSGPKEILENGKYGKLVEVKSPRKLAKAMQEALFEEKNSSMLKNRANDFHVTAICDEFEKLFQTA